MNHTAIFAALVALAFVVTGWLFGRTMVEKLITQMAMPVGFLWLLLIALTYFAFVSRQRFFWVITLICLVTLTMLGNLYVSNALIQSLERTYLDQPPVEPADVDTVVLLGGGTVTNLKGRSQLASHGDRVAAAARLYHRSVENGQPLQIICTGVQVYRSDASDLDPKDESKNCLVALGVAETNISTISGANTYEEMQFLKEWMDQKKFDAPIGILTSAWHLPRAMRLAEARGIEAKPIPSDFRSSFQVPSVGLVVPSAECLQLSTVAVKEYLARLVKR